jgi:hypothetical protein
MLVYFTGFLFPVLLHLFMVYCFILELQGGYKIVKFVSPFLLQKTKQMLIKFIVTCPSRSIAGYQNPTTAPRATNSFHACLYSHSLNAVIAQVATVRARLVLSHITPVSTSLRREEQPLPSIQHPPSPPHFSSSLASNSSQQPSSSIHSRSH